MALHEMRWVFDKDMAGRSVDDDLDSYKIDRDVRQRVIDFDNECACVLFRAVLCFVYCDSGIVDIGGVSMNVNEYNDLAFILLITFKDNRRLCQRSLFGREWMFVGW